MLTDASTFFAVQGTLSADTAKWGDPAAHGGVNAARHSLNWQDQGPSQFGVVFEGGAHGLTVSLLWCCAFGKLRNIPESLHASAPWGVMQEQVTDWLATLQGEDALEEMSATAEETAPACPSGCGCGAECQAANAIFIDEAPWGPAHETLLAHVQKENEATPATERKRINAERLNDPVG